ncbi:T6SS effector phospholipase Tle3 domain-containing protein [Burkholderia alba]|uniref:T6SS effector phospholipase Tle3 domain-containing protein n=1 Tax=Burkholderia alba TaxID=2683677 RepID=UPI002B05478E|nr:DUF3274 domain-containing protein [Burkholderia alba]
MTDNSSYNVAAQGAAATMACRPGDRPVQIPADRPGIVIVIHGVNDPGGSFGAIEKGLCDGLNDRLSRKDLSSGKYGADYLTAAKKKQPDRNDQTYLNDPEKYLYRREDDTSTHSFVIPFYWGYRASNNEIAKHHDAGDVKSKQEDPNGYLMTRGQYQDKKGNRLDKHFAKGGGFFANATNNIPDMYNTHFKAPWKGKQASKQGLAPNSSYIADAPERRYFVLAAERLANLISTIRGIQASDEAKAEGYDPANDTITVVGHSQGTIITLLAQALLAQRGERCVDCIIMVDSPYGFHTTDMSEQTGQAKLKTFIDIVNEVTQKPYSLPKLTDLLVACDQSGGRTGKGWTPEKGKRKDKLGNEVTFKERDNRGKVYSYFCPEDTVVALSNIHGIGTFGVPDDVETETYYRDPNRTRPQHYSQKLNAMKDLQGMRFFQRMWTRMERDRNGDGKFKKVLVGLAPARVPVRENAERLSVGPDTDGSMLGTAIVSGTNMATMDSHTRNEIRYINGEALTPPHEPDMYAGEAVQGGPKPGHADVAGKLAPDAIEQNVALGNQYASFKWIDVDTTMNPFADVDQYKAQFNASKSVEDQSQNWKLVPKTVLLMPVPGVFVIQREQTPNEARQTMSNDASTWDANNYHGAILRSSENQRWVTAMDVAIGQAVSMDDKDWRALLAMMADWKLDSKIYKALTNNPIYQAGKLDQKTAKLLEANMKYYTTGVFPPESVVSLETMPPLVTSETVAQQENPPSPPPAPVFQFGNYSGLK